MADHDYGAVSPSVSRRHPRQGLQWSSILMGFIATALVLGKSDDFCGRGTVGIVCMVERGKGTKLIWIIHVFQIDSGQLMCSILVVLKPIQTHTALPVPFPDVPNMNDCNSLLARTCVAAKGSCRYAFLPQLKWLGAIYV